jgi:hypothetical protein
MSVVRVVKKNQYTVIHNSPLQDKRLSLKARGLIAYCFSLPENWRYSIEGLVKAIGSDGRDSIRSGLKELENCGYLKRRRLHDEKGKFTDMEYIIYETAQTAAEENEEVEIEMAAEDIEVEEEPITEIPILADLQLVEPITEKPVQEKPVQEKPVGENRLQISKYNIQSKYKQNKYKTTTETAEKPGETDNALPEELIELAKRCCVSEKTVEVACEKFGTETVKRHLLHLARQEGIKRPDAWLMQSLRESWDIPGNRARPDCPECKGIGYTLFYYDDPQTETKQTMRLKCSKCCGG